MATPARRTLRLIATALAATLIVPLSALPGHTHPEPEAEASSQVMPPAPAVPNAPVLMEISTDGAAPVLDRDNYVPTTVALAGQSLRAGIKGRGNSTWGWAKKPYKIKLDQDASLLGMPATNEWVLLANYADRAGLRTQLAFAVASRTRLAWTPRTRSVEVVLNGEPLGLYTLTEQVEQGETRVALPDDGYLLEIDEKFRRTGDPGFRTRRRTPVAFKDPDELVKRERKMIRAAVNRFEKVLYGDDFADPTQGYTAYADLDTFVDWYLVQELFRNQDSNFYSSVHVTWHPGGRFAMGPVWDFDLSAGTRWQRTNPGPAPATEWYARLGSHWLSRMLQDPAFVARVQSRWAELKPQIDEIVAQVPQAGAVIRDAALRDWDRWHRAGDPAPGSVHATSFDGEVAFLHQWLKSRVEWLSRDQLYFDTTPLRVKESRGAKVPVRLWGDRTRPVRVRYAWETIGGADADDIENAAGELVFWPGQIRKKVHLRLRDDAVAEADESFALVLTVVEGGAILGTPNRLPVTIAASDQQPDLMIGKRRRTLKGDDVYTLRPARQQVRSRLARGSRQVLTARVANDGTARAAVRVRALPPARGLNVRYRVGRKDITSAVRSPRGWAPRVRPGAHRTVRIIVRARRGARPGVRSVGLRAEWRGDTVLRDAVRARVKVTR